MVNFVSLIKDLPSSVPFVGPEAQERIREIEFKARIGANENVFGPSPKALSAMKDSLNRLWMYGDPENYDLKRAISNHHKVNPENVVVGEGIDCLLGYLVRLLVEPGRSVVTSHGAYPTFNYHVKGYGGHLHYVPYKDDYEDIEGLLEKAISTKAALIYISNPDNPMGTWHEKSVIENLVDNLPQETVLCLDEAYSDFVPPDDLPSLDLTQPNVIRFRTFSKAYGMAGARVGYAISSTELIGSFEKIRNHFGVNLIAQVGAFTALHDQAYLSEVLQKVDFAKEEIVKIATENDLIAIPSKANFVAIDCGRDGDYANYILDNLLEKNIFLRMPSVTPLNRCIRVSAGTQDDLRLLRLTLPEAIKKVKKL